MLVPGGVALKCRSVHIRSRQRKQATFCLFLYDKRWQCRWRMHNRTIPHASHFPLADQQLLLKICTRSQNFLETCFPGKNLNSIEQVWTPESAIPHVYMFSALTTDPVLAIYFCVFRQAFGKFQFAVFGQAVGKFSTGRVPRSVHCWHAMGNCTPRGKWFLLPGLLL